MPDPNPSEDKDAAVLKRLYAEDPEIRRLVQRRVKKDNPNAVFPELEVEDKVAAVTQTFGEKLDKTNEELQRTNIKLTRAEQHDKWRKQGLDPEAIEATIAKYGLSGSKDLPVEQAALRILEAEAATAEGSTESVREHGRMRLDDEWSKVAKQPDNVINAKAQDLAHKAIDEINQSKRQSQRGFQSTGLRFAR